MIFFHAKSGPSKSFYYTKAHFICTQDKNVEDDDASTDETDDYVEMPDLIDDTELEVTPPPPSPPPKTHTHAHTVPETNTTYTPPPASSCLSVSLYVSD